MPRFALLMILPALTMASAAQAQTWSPRAGQPALDIHRQQLDAHRLEMDRLRLRTDQRELEARQAALESRLSVMRTEAARRPDVVTPSAITTVPPPRSAASAAQRRETVQGSVGQIDAWLDRRPD